MKIVDEYCGNREDITGTSTDPFHYKVHFYTAMPDIDMNH